MNSARILSRAGVPALLAALCAPWGLALAPAAAAQASPAQAAAAPQAPAVQLPPDQLVKNVSSEVLQIIRTDKEVQAGNPKRIAEVIETKLLPHFDFARMTALAMGRNWNRATPAQQKALTDEFRTLLVRTYSGALNTYRNHTVDFKPLRAGPADTEVVVRTAVVQPGGQPIPIDYSMEKKPEGWKCYDVIIAGASLVTNYREEFTTMVKESGIDGLIKALADKNRGVPRA
jgi:phospholipid transport system substrate-binding protein